MTRQYIQPPFLQKGDKVSIVAPAGKITPDALSSALAVLEEWGLVPCLGKNLFHQFGSLAGNDQQRLEDLQEALDNSRYKAIFCARGGYGTTRIVDRLNFSRFRKNPKWLVGFSDITTLHAALHRQGVQSIHALMPVQFGKEEYHGALEELRKLLLGEQIRFNYQQPVADYFKTGISIAPIVGGNLSLLVSQLATPTTIDFKGKILFLEETGEYLYHIDRMMTQLKRAGVFDDIVGLVVGHFSIKANPNNEFPFALQEIVLEKITQSYPVAFGFPFGHEAPNFPVICGAKVLLEVNSKTASLSFVLNSISL